MASHFVSFASVKPPRRRPLLIATTSAHKLAEIGRALNAIGVEAVGPTGALRRVAVEESGATFAANARLKAAAYARAGGCWSLADDSGLEVDALGGAPGVYSSRFAGPRATDADRIEYLLDRLRGVPGTARTARFRCAVAIARPDGTVAAETVGRCEGRIALTPRGRHGFGYDPVFELAGDDRTLAQLTEAEKESVGHRGQALRAAHDFLRANLPSV